ncbi:MAG: pyruvate, water dikinase regulatory protein [Bacillota bacterium]
MRATIYVVSDSVGETAEAVAVAAASQFNSGELHIKKYGHVTEPGQIDEIVSNVDPARSVIVYTLVVPELRNRMSTLCALHGIRAVDVMGPLLEALQQITGIGPWLEPGRSRKIDQNYFRKIEAIEFAVKCDDGKDVRALKEADVVLLGVSRTSKTPVSMYLAYRAVKVANIPLIPEVPLPQEIFSVPRNRIVGLTISAEKLHSIRLERAKAMGLPPDSKYCSKERIAQELSYAEQVFKQLGCAVIDVSNRAVEETASRVLALIGNEVLGRGLAGKS